MTRSKAIGQEDAAHQTRIDDDARAEALAVDLLFCGSALVMLSLPTLMRPRSQGEPAMTADPEAPSALLDRGGSAAAPNAAAEEKGSGWATAGLAIALGAGAALALPMGGAERRPIQRMGLAAGRILRHQALRELSWAQTVTDDVALASLDAVDAATQLLLRCLTRSAAQTADTVAADHSSRSL